MTAAGQVYLISNIALVVGYLVLPVLIVPYLSFRKRTRAAWMVFFVGCVGTHALSVWQEFALVEAAGHHGGIHGAGWPAALWHAGQAVGTWAAIVWTHRELVSANALLESVAPKRSS